jgi:hypothetical protein
MMKKSLIIADFACLVSVAAHGATVKVTREACNHVVALQPSADVAYKPGVDVNGNSTTDRKYESNAQIGVVSYRDGQVFYNGKPLQGGQNEIKIAVACKRLLNRMN